MRTADGAGVVPVPAFELFNRCEIPGRMAMGKMLGGLLSRRYTVGLDSVRPFFRSAARSALKRSW